MRKTLLAIVQDTPRSTAWSRANRDRVKARDDARKSTLEGKLISLITQSRYRAKKNGIEHNIDTAFVRSLWEYQDGKCALTGAQMLVRTERRSPDWPYTVSLDRIDSNRGYTKDNVQLVCSGANVMKNTLSVEQLRMFCKSILDNN